MLLHYALARRYFPEDYLRMVKLRMPAYVKLILANEFPRTQVSSRAERAAPYITGRFQSRGAAELFEDQFLDLFQIRRCQENLEPSPQHPGCIYGEMNRCLRPCQQVVSREEYLSEVERVEEFLTGNGAALISVASAARDRLSGEMNFEEAARQHKRLERIQAVLALRGDLVSDIDRLYGVAVAPGSRADSVLLWFVCQGAWQAPMQFPLTSLVSLDHRLRELVASHSAGDAAAGGKAGASGVAGSLALFHAGATASGSAFPPSIRRPIGSWCGLFRGCGRKRRRQLSRARCRKSRATSRAARCCASTS